MLSEFIESKYISKQETATELGVSVATISNWVKSGLLNSTTSDNAFVASEVADLKGNIKDGVVSRLNGRANKLNTSRNFIPTEYFTNIENLSKIEEILNYVFEQNLGENEAIFYLALILQF